MGILRYLSAFSLVHDEYLFQEKKNEWIHNSKIRAALSLRLIQTEFIIFVGLFGYQSWNINKEYYTSDALRSVRVLNSRNILAV